MELTEEERKRAENNVIKEGASYGLMDGFGLRYTIPYAIAMGASNFLVSLLSSLPLLFGNLIQLHGLQILRKRTRKRIAVIGSFIQALFWVPIIFIGFLYFIAGISSVTATWTLLLIYTLMISAGTITIPSWNSWMKDLIKKRGAFFGKRNTVINFVTIICILTAGVVLSFFDKRVFFGFLIIFLIAFAGRLISSYFLKKQYEPPFKYEQKDYFSFFQFLKKMFKNNFGKFVLFISFVSFSTAVASPFFVVYMLNDLGFSYIEYTIVILGGVISTIVFMPIWGRFSDEYGNLKVFKMTGFLVALPPILWLATLFIRDMNLSYLLVTYLFLIEIISGFIWAGFNLSAGNFIYDAVSREKMHFCIAYFNITNAIGLFLGAVLGGLITSQNFFTLGLGPILFVFLISGVLRFLSVLIFLPSIKEVRAVKEFRLRKTLKENLRKRGVDLLRYIGYKPLRIKPPNHIHQ